MGLQELDNLEIESWIVNSELQKFLEELIQLNEASSKNGVSSGNLQNELELAMELVNTSMIKMTSMIEQSKLQASLNQEAANLSPQILDLCQQLMHLMRDLLKHATELQQEIVSSSGQLSPSEFYHKNSQWTDGFISAAKACGWAVNLLTESADIALKNEAGIEKLEVSCKEIVAATVQMNSAGKSKNINSVTGNQKLNNLNKTSNLISKCAGQVLAKVKAETEHKNNKDLDLTLKKFGSFNLQRKQEIDSQVKIVELEKELNRERLRLKKFRNSLYDNNTNQAEEQDNSNSNEKSDDFVHVKVDVPTLIN